jgi:hypothetical protein
VAHPAEERALGETPIAVVTVEPDIDVMHAWAQPGERGYCPAAISVIASPPGVGWGLGRLLWARHGRWCG